MTDFFTRAIVTVSFGTSVPETRIKTLEAIENTIRAAYPDFLHKRAWTSQRLRTNVRKTEGLNINSVSEALAQIASVGIEEVYIQPTFVTNGNEYQKLLLEAAEFKHQFRTLCVCSPLMENEEDIALVTQVITQSSSYLWPKSDELLLFMGHGNSDGDDLLYEQLDQRLQSCSIPNLRLKTMSSKTAIDEIIVMAQNHHITKITLAPFMIVAGLHALKDMAGNHADSWKSRLEASDFQVHCEMKGLGEIPEIQQLFLHRLNTLFLSSCAPKTGIRF